ncbi:MAG: UDP-N-acetylmuramoyl-L-alanine--D-glutamate ligase [Nitrospirae bacterium]|nr:UDP-N-acetylmuramoyl-L-alanine--D-glutamate ligase [Nitrospirota bacterium]
MSGNGTNGSRAHPPDLTGRKVCVVGLAVTGQSVARFLLKRGAAVSGLDERTDARMRAQVQPLARRGMEVRLGPLTPDAFEGADLIIISPGVSVHHPALETVRGRVPIWGEVELAYRFLDAPLIGVTGTNGKSTTVVLLGCMLKRAGYRTFVGGNLGQPLIEAVGGKWDRIVCELSSFQGEAVETFRPSIGVVLNVSDNHLDRHKDFAEYLEAKRNLFRAQRREDVLVVNADDPVLRSWAAESRARVYGFSRTRRQVRGAWGGGRGALFADGRKREAFPLANLRINETQNLENILAAATAARLAGCPAPAVRKALKSFRGLPHRLEEIGRVDGVRFVDDSKATNVAAVARALDSVPGRTVLILGGLDKGGDFGQLTSRYRKVRHAVLIGQARERIYNSIKGWIPTSIASSMEGAVRQAWRASRPGDVILLSPGCASFDMFESYAHRGEKFRQAAARLAARRGRSQGKTARRAGKARPRAAIGGGRFGAIHKGEHEARMC